MLVQQVGIHYLFNMKETVTSEDVLELGREEVQLPTWKDNHALYLLNAIL